MLERVAAGLNRRGCTLPNVRTASFSSTRLLHSAFWVHAGESLLSGHPSDGHDEAAESLQDAFFGRLRSITSTLSKFGPVSQDSTGYAQQDPFVVSAFGLDFLYPPKAIALLQRLTLRDGSRNVNSRAAHFPRSYSSFVGDSSREKREAKLRAEIAAREDDEWEYGQSGQAPGFIDKKRKGKREKFTQSERMERTLQAMNPIDFDYSPRSYDRAWAWYLRKEGAPTEPVLKLEPDSQRRRFLLGYLTNSNRQIDLERTVVFVEEIPVVERRVADWRALVKACLSLNQIDRAYVALSKLVEQTIAASNVGFEDFITHCIKINSWDRAVLCWQLLQADRPKSTLDIEAPSLPRFTDVHSRFIVKEVPHFAQKYTSWVSNLLQNDAVGREFAVWLFHGALKEYGQVDTAFSKAESDRMTQVLVERGWYDPSQEDMEYAILGISYASKHEEVIQKYSEHRNRPNVQPSNRLLYRVLYATICTQDFKAMQMVFDDWFKYHTHPTVKAYRAMMDAFAKQGESNIVEELFKQFSARFDVTADDYVHVLRAYVERGENATAVEKLEGMSHMKLTPNLWCYNTLLRGFAQAEDMESAMDYLNVILELGLEPDSRTYGSMMYVCAARGDFENVDLLFRTAVKKIIPTMTMWNMVVWSHVNGGARSLAWKLINFIHRQNMGFPLTHMYNMLMSAHANAKEVPNVNRIYKQMQDREVPFNFHSYAIMMRALTQSQHRDNLKKARQMLDMLQSQGISSNSVPYTTLMHGFLKRRKYTEVFAIFKTMTENKVEPDFSAQTMLLLASIFEAQELAKLTGKVDLTNAEEIAQLAIDKFSGFDPTNYSPNKTAIPTQMFTPLISAYIYKEDYPAVRATYKKFLELSSLKGVNAIKPTMNMYLKLLHACARERNWVGLREIWEQMYRKAQYRSRPLVQISSGSNVVTVKKREMCPALDIMLKAAIDSTEIAGGDDEAITLEEIYKYIKDIVSWGFDLDGGNWNSLIVLISKYGDLEQAFRLGESMLVREEALEYRIRMQKRFGFIGWAKHAQHPHVHTLDILGGQMNRLYALMRTGDESAEHARKMAKRISTEAPIMWKICNIRRRRGLRAETTDVHNKILDFAEISRRAKVERLKITHDFVLAPFRIQKERYLEELAAAKMELPVGEMEYEIEINDDIEVE